LGGSGRSCFSRAGPVRRAPAGCRKRDAGVRVDGGALAAGIPPSGPGRSAVSSSRIRCEAWAYRPRIRAPGAQPLLGRISGMRPQPSTSCGCACGVRRHGPSLTAASRPAASSLAACSPLPGQSPTAFLWAMVLSVEAKPDRRTVRLGSAPSSPALIRRGEPRPAGERGRPGTAGARCDGTPAIRRRPRRPACLACRSLAVRRVARGRKTRRAKSCCAGGGRVGAGEHVPATAALRCGAGAPPPCAQHLPGDSSSAEEGAGMSTGTNGPRWCCGRSRPSADPVKRPLIS